MIVYEKDVTECIAMLTHRSTMATKPTRRDLDSVCRERATRSRSRAPDRVGLSSPDRSTQEKEPGQTVDKRSAQDAKFAQDTKLVREGKRRCLCNQPSCYDPLMCFIRWAKQQEETTDQQKACPHKKHKFVNRTIDVCRQQAVFCAHCSKQISRWLTLHVCDDDCDC